jgi:hypothetical protein
VSVIQMLWNCISPEFQLVLYVEVLCKVRFSPTVSWMLYIIPSTYFCGPKLTDLKDQVDYLLTEASENRVSL